MENNYCSEVKVGMPVSDFQTEALLPNGEFKKVSLKDNMDANKWTILFFWPKDFTFVCPTEIVALSDTYEKFVSEGAEIYGISTDSAFVHKAWTNVEVNNGGIGKVNFPLLEDTNHKISKQFGVLIEEAGVALRGMFIISPEGVLEHSTINNLNVGRNVDEALRVLAALKSGGLCPMNWHKGDKNL